MEISQPASAGDSQSVPSKPSHFNLKFITIRHRYRPLRRLSTMRLSTWGSAPLHPRLYAFTCFRRLAAFLHRTLDTGQKAEGFPQCAVAEPRRGGNRLTAHCEELQGTRR